MPTRRDVLTAALAAATGGSLAAGLYTWLVEPHWLELTQPDLPIRGLPEALEGATIAHFTDLHIGPKVSDDYVSLAFRRVAALTPDFVVFTGDWITYRGPAQLEQLARVLRHVPHGRLGTLGVLGNHDYGFEWRMAEVGDQVAAIARNAGVEVLRNEASRVAGLQFLGLDDLWGPRFDPVGVLDRHGGDAATLVLCHNPDMADRPIWGEFRGWILAGHTHGGQCKPPFLRPPLLPVRNKHYAAGEVALAGDRRLYISRGVGHLLKVRFNARPEVPVFRLRPAIVSENG